YLNCDPVVLNYYSFDRFIGSVVRFRSPPPACGAPACVLWGACVSEVRLDFGLLQQNKFNPQRLSFESLHVQACRAVVGSIAHSVTAATSATMSALALGCAKTLSARA